MEFLKTCMHQEILTRSGLRAGDGRFTDPTKRSPLWLTAQTLIELVGSTYLDIQARNLGSVPPRGGVILASNHTSHLDNFTLPLYLERPVAFLAGADTVYFRNKYLHWLTANLHMLPLERIVRDTEAGTRLRAHLDRATDLLRQGWMIGMYPEGTRTRDGSLGPFKSGFAQLARRAGTPIIPAGIAGAYDVFPHTARFPRRGNIRIVYGDALNPDAMQELPVSEIVALTRDKIIQCTEEAACWLNNT